MVEKSYSDAKPSKVSVEKVGKFTSVWLRKNIIEDTADQGPDGSESIAFWTWDEVFFSVPGNMTESEALERFDELWSAHERDGMTAEEMAREAVAEAKEAKELAGSAGPDPQLQALETNLTALTGKVETVEQAAETATSTGADTMQAVGELGAMMDTLQQSNADIMQAIGELGTLIGTISAGGDGKGTDN